MSPGSHRTPVCTDSYMPLFGDTTDQIPSYSLDYWQSKVSETTSELPRPFLQGEYRVTWVSQQRHLRIQSPEPSLVDLAVLAKILPC